MDIGKLLPDPSGEDKVKEWRVPVCVFNARTGEKFEVTNIYEDEGFLCIDIAVEKPIS